MMTLKQRAHELALAVGATTDRDHEKIEIALMTEREDCAKIAENKSDRTRRSHIIAAAIRKAGHT